ncbi:MAG TPA: VTC domain-containing protein [Candidatus Eisenbacteria bacterium]|nr:VTC domain-containing protein [Candidatus Eisenbacteria bacterium]
MASWQVTTVSSLDDVAGGRDIEQKFLFAGGKRELLLDWLEFHLLRDPAFYFSPIASLYYDTPVLSLYREARDGNYVKTKVRLRWYETVHAADRRNVTCYLEVKRKLGILRHKQRKRLELDGADLAGDVFTKSAIIDLPATLPELKYWVRGPLVPILIVEYERYRFVDFESGARVALDSRVACRRSNPAYLVPSFPVQLSCGVLEVKGGLEALPDRLAPMARHLSRQSFSKYAACARAMLEPLSWEEPA